MIMKFQLGFIGTMFNREDASVRLLPGFFINLRPNEHFNEISSVFGEYFVFIERENKEVPKPLFLPRTRPGRFSRGS